MKLLKSLLLGTILLLAGAPQAQVSLNFNIGSPPGWCLAGYTNLGLQ